jgi:hypothetical protein
MWYLRWMQCLWLGISSLSCAIFCAALIATSVFEIASGNKERLRKRIIAGALQPHRINGFARRTGKIA